MKTGDHVSVTCDGRTLDAMVLLASSNGKSAMLFVDGAIKAGKGYLIGMVPVLLDEDGVYYTLIGKVAVTINEVKDH